MERKVCSRCKRSEPVSAFSKATNRKDGLQNYCKPCDSKAGKDWRNENRERANAFQRLWRSENPDKVREYGRKSYLQIRYGLTEDDYLKMVSDREGKCDICGEVLELFVDHCHDTGYVRGLLCNLCNFSLGGFREDLNILMNAMRYLHYTKTNESRGRINGTRR